jgi:hypothetical protein
MSTEIVIENGPGFKQLLSCGPLAEAASPLLRFTIKEPNTGHYLCLGQQNHEARQWYAVGLVFGIGTFNRQEPGASRKRVICGSDEQVIMIESRDEHDQTYFILAKYNTSTRKGEGVVLTKREFYNNPIASILRGDNGIDPYAPPADWPGIFREPKVCER